MKHHLCCVVLSRDVLSKHISKAKLSLLSCISVSSEKKIQGLGLQVRLGKKYLQICEVDYSILCKVHS